MICVSVYEPTVEACLDSLKGLDFAEVRIDAMAHGTVDDMRRIFSQPLTLIATFRPQGPLDDGGHIPGDATRKRLLMAAIEAGANYVDIEAGSDRAYREEIIAKARSKDCKVIVSSHNFDETPEAGELIATACHCLDEGADIVKIACMVNSDRDNVRLLGILSREDLSGRTVVIGMGTKGRITRVAGPLFGSPFTFASLSDEKRTAEGQMDMFTMELILKALKDGRY
ncbi:MAG: type I 3-dehydroquinate dehydratase [Syntrophorhabdaceae bacterium]|nr:type I 3-dehydroquinate dehydratase [Syntrophorhabdaceae bacterium]MDD4196456.1 type I 3-dehydroquinate dehydratase [Syntrophorhabdaceae bacterium]HOC46655.1 type I 3-dehydroquinate dehydratase [Syntrophorhabdaceae bacterium]